MINVTTSKIRTERFPLKGTLYNYTQNGTGATQNVHTVAAGKVAYVIGVNTKADCGFNLRNQDDDTNIFAIEGNVTFVSPFGIAEYAATEIVKVVATNAKGYSLVILEVDA